MAATLATRLPPTGDASAARWKRELAEGREAIRAAFVADHAPHRLLAAQAQLVDRVLRGLWADIGATIQRFAEGHGFSVVREFCGHGIGRQFHEEPQVLHYGKAGTGMKLQPGMIFTIEPMINAGRAAIRGLADGWTIVTADHSLSAQWEHTVLVTEQGYEVLTLSAGAPPPPLAAAA